MWTTMASMIEPRLQFGLAATADHVYALGGQNFVGGQFHTLSSMEAYSFATGTWSETAGLPAKRAAFAALPGADGRIYALGGHILEADGITCSTGTTTTCTYAPAYSSALAYSPASDSWTSIAEMPTQRLYMAGAAGPDGLLYTIGGGAGASQLSTSIVEAYDPATDTWHGVAPMPTPRTQLAAITGPDGRIYALGGFTGVSYDEYQTPLATVEAYTPATNSWQVLASMPTPRINFAVAVGIDGKIYAIGGWNAAGTPAMANVEAYTPATNTWEVVASLPSPRLDFAAATGPASQLLVFGGDHSRYDQHELATVDAYVP
jgi:N-acetylneuraminic acid mutarotase